MADTDGKVWIETSGDEMSATAFITPPEGGGKAVEVGNVKAALRDAGVVYGIVNNERILGFVEQGKNRLTDFIAAVGTLPGHGQDAAIEYLWKREDVSTEIDGKVDLRELNIVESARKGELLARKTLTTRGEEGISVFGKKTPGEWGSDAVLKAGANVEVSEDGVEFTAVLDGSPKLAAGVLSVDPVFTIKGDVDYSVGNINFAGALEIRGSVMDGFVVKADGNIVIGKNVQAAEIISGGDITVKGGVITRKEGTISARGSVRAKFIENSIVEAEGDVTADRAIINSSIRSNGAVICSSREGKIMGGDIMAYREIRAKNLGTENETPTFLRAGFKYESFLELSDLEKKLEKTVFEINRIQKSLASAKPGQAESVETLRASMSQLDAAKTGLLQRLAVIKTRFQVNPFAVVKGEETIHPGCVISIGNSKEKVMNPMRYATLSADKESGISLASFDEKTGAIRTSNVGTKEKKKTVMIVDDAKFMRTKLKNILENGDFKVLGEAEDGAQAVQMFPKLNPDLVTMDITMPNLDGLEALKQIKSAHPQAKVVMISALGQKERVKDCLIAGAMDFVVKPFVPEKVIEVLTRVVSR